MPDDDDCSNRMTDLPYGTLRFKRGATTVEIADSPVANWWRAGTVLRTEGPDTAASNP